jgi:hypothetical protein
MVDCGLQRSFGRSDGLPSHLLYQLDGFGPLPFSAPMEVQRIYHAHWVNLTDTPTGVDRCLDLHKQ